MKQKTIVLAASLIFSFAVQNATAQTQIGLDMDGEAAGDNSGYSVSMPDSSAVAIGAYLNDGSGGADNGHSIAVDKLKITIFAT